jgi:hypothetical protein
MMIWPRRWRECKFHYLLLCFPHLFSTACKILYIAHPSLSQNCFSMVFLMDGLLFRVACCGTVLEYAHLPTERSDSEYFVKG